MLRSVRVFLLAFTLIALPLGVLAWAGIGASMRQLAHAREVAAEQTLGAVAALLADTQEGLRREAVLLARDPGIIEGAVKGDWATLARGASPRILAVTREGFADLVVVRDLRGSPLVQVPAMPPLALPAIPPVVEPTVALRVVNGRPYFLAAAPIFAGASPQDGARVPVGLVVVGRRFEALGRLTDRVPARPGVLFVAGDRLLGSTRPDAPLDGWTATLGRGGVTLGREPFILRPLGAAAAGSPDGSLWALVPDGEFRHAQRKLWLGLTALLGAAALILAAWVAMLTRRGGGRGRSLADGPRPEGWRQALERRNRELEALNAIAVTIGRSADLVSTAEETLDVVRGVARMDVGAVYRLDATAGRLVLLAQRGLSAEQEERIRVRPVDGSHIGEAARIGQVQVVHLDVAPPAESALREMAVAREHRTQLALPIPVKDQTWGVMALISQEKRDFTADELAVLDAVAHHVGLAVERAQLRETAAARLNRLEAQRQIERHISEQLDLEQLLVLVANAALRLIGGSISIVYLREGDMLCPRAWAQIGSWIRDVRVPVGAGVAGTAVATGRGLIVNDYAHSPLAIPPFNNASQRLLAQPLVAGARALGVIVISRDEAAEPFTEDDLSTVADFATQTVVALDNARLFAEAKRTVDEYQALLEVGGLIASTLDVDRVLDLIVDRCQALMGVRAAGIFRMDAETGCLVHSRGKGLSAEYVEGIRIRVGEGTAGRAVEEIAPAWSADTLTDRSFEVSDETRALVVREGYRAVLSVPVVIKGQPFGALAVYWWEPHTPSPGELALMTALAGQAAVALENARLFAEAKRSAAEYQALFEVGALVGSILDVNRVLDLIVDRCRALLGVAGAGVFRLDPAGGYLSYERGIGLSPEFVRALRVEVGEGTTGKAVEQRAPVWTADLLADPFIPLSADTRALVEREGYRAVLSVPILAQGAAHGVLAVYWWETHTPSPSEIALMTALAGQAAVALDNARLYEALEVRANRLRALARLAHVVSSSLDMDEVLATIARAAAELTNVPLAGFWIANETARTLELRALSDEAMAADFPHKVMRYDESAIGWVATHRRPLDIPDVLTDARFVAKEWAGTHGLRSFFAAPIVFQDSLLGVLALNGRTPLRPGPDDLQLLDTFVAQAGVAIRNARLYADTATRLAQTRALLEVAEILNSTLEPGRVLKPVAIKIGQVCRVDRCSIERWDGDRVIPLMSQFADGRTQPGLWTAFTAMTAYSPREIPLHAQAIATRRPAVIPDTTQTDLIPREWIDTFGIKSCMVVPLIRQDEVIGVMTLDYAERATAFEPWQLELAMAIGVQVALSIENTRLYVEAQERLKETRALLAVGQALSQPGSAVEVMRRAAREMARAFGADMVGVYELDERKEALVPMAGYRVPKEVREAFLTRPFVLSQFPAIQDVWRRGRAVWSGDFKNDPRFGPANFEGLESHSVLFAPTSVRGVTVGALFLVWWAAGRQFQPEEIRLIEGVAAQVGLAMENAELARRTQLKLNETETLLSVSQTLSSTLDLERLPRQFLRHVVQALGADTAGIWLLEEDGEWLRPFVGYHVPSDKLERLRTLRLSIVRDPFYAEAARTRQSVVSTDVMGDPRIPQSVRDAEGQSTQLFVPIVAKDRMIGGFAAIWWDRARPLSESELRLMEAIASQVGVALENARLFLDNQRRVEELSVLHELSRAVTGQLDQAQVVEAARQQAARVLDTRHMAVVLYDETRQEFERVLRTKDGISDTTPRGASLSEAGLLAAVLGDRRPVRTEDYAAECRRRGISPIESSVGLPHWLGVPMLAGEQLLGVVVLRAAERPFTEADERLLANIAGLAALALRSARLYEERARAFGELAAAQDQLVRTEKLRALGEMASGVAHDFNNVLASILGRAQLLLEKVEEPKARRWLRVIERAAMDGARTVRRLQDFTRIRRDQPVVSVDLNQVIQHVLEATESTWQQQARSRGINIEVATALATPLPRVAGDPAELREALTNLILNAVDAMPRGGRLTLTTAAAGGRVEVTVADTGIGIPEGVRQKIFDPFFTTKGPRGTGLGLSMTYGILSRHGGQITVESEEGRGTTFHLVFPPAEEIAEVAAEPAPAQPAAPLRCLVVDDETVVGEVLGDMLMAAGQSVVVVTSGQEAIARFKAEPFDVVFTDLAMPGMTGWEVARAVKDLAPAVRVGLVSGFGVEVSAADLQAHGVDLVLAKPLKIPDVLRALDSLRAGAGNQKRETEP